jgi:hypothetical protein
MKNIFLKGFASLVVAVFVLTSCAELPQAEIDTAKAAVDQAQAAGADIYVADSYVMLQDSLKGAMVLIEEQNTKFFKDYSSAIASLNGAATFAAEVKVQAETRKEEIKTEIQDMIVEVQSLIDTNKQLVLNAPKGKEGASALQAINAEIIAIELSVSEATTAFEGGELITTFDKVKAAKEKATSINTELNEVIAKYKGKRRA